MITILNHRDQPLPEDNHCKNAIVSIVMGDRYQTPWNAACKNSWTAYADKYGYDIIIIQCHLDDSERAHARSVSWQKLLILNQPWARHYERLVWVDSDIVFSNAAPDIIKSMPDHRRVGICECSDQLSVHERLIYVERLLKIDYGAVDAVLMWKFFQENNYATYGIKNETGIMYGAGVLVLSPMFHNALLLHVYENEDRGRLYEQPFLSHALLMEGAHQKLSPRFNWGVLEFLVMQFPEFFGKTATLPEVKAIWPHLMNELSKAYFLHFAGCPSVFQHYATIVSAAADASEGDAGLRVA